MVYRIGEALDYDPFEESDVIDSPTSFSLGEPLEIDPFEYEPQASDMDEPDEGGHSLWDIPRLMGKGAGGVVKTASMVSAILDPIEWANRTMGVVGDFTQAEALQTFRDFSAEHGKSAKLRQFGEVTEDYYDEKLTPAMKRSMKKTILASGKEEGIFGEGIKDPWKIGGMIAESIPSTALSMGSGALITKGLIQTGLKSAPKIVQSVIQKLVKKYGVNAVAGVAGGAAGEGTYSGLENANQAFEEMMAQPTEKMAQSPVYRDIYNSLPAKFTSEQKHAYSKKILATATGGFVGSVTAVTTAILGAPSGAFLGKLIGGQAGKSLWGNLLKGAMTESFEETGQSGMERLVTNFSTKFLVDPNQEITEGALEAMAAGAVTGFAMGGGMATIAGREGAKPPAEATAKDILTGGEDITAKDVLIESEQERIREAVEGKAYRGAESIEAEEEAGEFAPEELAAVQPPPIPKEAPSDRIRRKRPIQGQKPQRQEPVKAPELPKGKAAPAPGRVLQAPKTDVDQQKLAEFDAIVGRLKPEQRQKVEDLIKDTKMPIAERLDLLKQDLVSQGIAKERRKVPIPKRPPPPWDRAFRAIHTEAQKQTEAEFIQSSAGRVKAGDVDFLDMARRLGQPIEPDTDLDDALKTVYSRIQAGMEPRKRVQEMSDKELRSAIMTDYLTGLKSKHAFEVEDPRKKHVASIDLDSLKYFNDSFGHQAGDEMLIAFGNALKGIGADAYHISGDEYVVQHDDDAELKRIIDEDVAANLKKFPIRITLPDGKKINYEVQFSYGTGQTITESEEALHAHKALREATGIRAGRGEVPRGILENLAEGRPPGDRRQEIPEKELVGGPRKAPIRTTPAPPRKRPVVTVKGALKEGSDREKFFAWVNTLNDGEKGAVRTFIERDPANAGWSWGEHLTKAKQALADKLEAAAILRGEKPSARVSPKPARPAAPEEITEPVYIEGHLQTPDRFDQWWMNLPKARATAKDIGFKSNQDPTADPNVETVINWNDLDEIVRAIDLYDDIQLGKPPEPEFEPEFELIKGRAVKIITPGNRRGYSGYYSLVEADSLIPSHSPTTFQKNPSYPEGIQERTYHTDKTEQEKVILNAQQLSPSILLSNDPTPTNGPPIVTDTGIVLGGNSRAMSLQRAYAGAQGAKYKNVLAIKARSFGLKPKDVTAMDKPVLARTVYLDKKDVQTLHRMASDFNKALTQGMSQEAQIASMGRNISMDTVEKIGLRMANRDLSLRELLGKKDGLEILQWLIDDDVVAATDRNSFVSRKANLLNDTGKSLIEKALFGSIIDDADLISAAPRMILNKIDRSLTSLARIKARGDQWDITPQLKDAVQLATAAKAEDLSTREYIAQGSLFGDKKAYSDIAVTLADSLINEKPTKLADRFKRFAADAMADAKDQTFLFAPKTFSQAFEDAFGQTVAEPGAPAPTKTIKELVLLSPDEFLTYFQERIAETGEDSGINYTETFEIEETGESIEREIDAVAYLNDIDEELNAYEALLNCMSGRSK